MVLPATSGQGRGLLDVAGNPRAKQVGLVRNPEAGRARVEEPVRESVLRVEHRLPGFGFRRHRPARPRGTGAANLRPRTSIRVTPGLAGNLGLADLPSSDSRTAPATAGPDRVGRRRARPSRVAASSRGATARQVRSPATRHAVHLGDPPGSRRGRCGAAADTSVGAQLARTTADTMREHRLRDHGITSFGRKRVARRSSYPVTLSAVEQELARGDPTARHVQRIGQRRRGSWSDASQVRSSGRDYQVAEILGRSPARVSRRRSDRSSAVSSARPARLLGECDDAVRASAIAADIDAVHAGPGRTSRTLPASRRTVSHAAPVLRSHRSAHLRTSSRWRRPARRPGRRGWRWRSGTGEVAVHRPGSRRPATRRVASAAAPLAVGDRSK